MKDSIVEVLKSFEDFGSVDSEYFLSVAEKIEKLYESHIKTGIVNSLPGAKAAIDAGVQLVKDHGIAKPYDKSKFRLFPTWKETKEVSEISEEEFLGFYDGDTGCSGFNSGYGFEIPRKGKCNEQCRECVLDCYAENTKADIIKWMEETR
jgi:hypothetical protein